MEKANVIGVKTALETRYIGKQMIESILNNIYTRPSEFEDLLRLALQLSTAYSVHFIIMHPDISWSWPFITSQISGISYFITKPELPWDYAQLGKRLCKDDYGSDFVPFMIATQNKNWDWNSIRCDKLPIDLVDKLPDKNWNYKILSAHPKLSLKHVLDHLQCNWDYNLLMERLIVDFQLLKQYPNILRAFDNKNKIKEIAAVYENNVLNCYRIGIMLQQFSTSIMHTDNSNLNNVFGNEYIISIVISYILYILY